MCHIRVLAVCGAVAALLAVALGAFGAHGLRTILLPEQLATYQTGVTYQMWHALGMLLCVAMVQLRLAGAAAVLAGWLFLAGMALFSGSLYALSLTEIRGLGFITPVGGLCFLIGWLSLAVGFTGRYQQHD